MKKHAVTRPWLHPVEAKIGKENRGLDVITADAPTDDIAQHFPKHDTAKRHTEEDEPSDVHGPPERTEK